MTTEQLNQLPDEIQDGRKGSWRCTNGVVQRGRRGEEEIVKGLIGILTEITIWEGTQENKHKQIVPVKRLLVRIKTKHTGIETIGAYILNKEGSPSMYGLWNLAIGVLYAEKWQGIQITAQHSKPNAAGERVTYTNVLRIDPATGTLLPYNAKSSRSDYPGKDYNWKTDLEEMLDDIRKHPAYKPFDYGAPKEFLDFCSEDGWPNPKDVPQAYCELFGKALKREVKALSEVTTEEWTELLAICKKKDSVPKILVDAVAAKVPAATNVIRGTVVGVDPDDYDPFADE